MSHWEEALKQTQKMLERLYLSAGLGMPLCPPGQTGGGGLGEGGV